MGSSDIPAIEEFRRLRERLAELEKENLSLARQLEVATAQLLDPAALSREDQAKSVGKIASGIAHDLNNLLTIINGYSTLLADRLDLSDDVRSDLSSIRRAGERAAALTMQLAAFGRKATSPQSAVLTNRDGTGST